MNRNINKSEFIAAYCYLYGATKTKAAAVYKQVNNEYKKAIIESLKADAKKAFYND